jgi:hypothetical protein
MYRLVCPAVLAATILGIAAPTYAQLPMSPALRTGQSGKERPPAKASAGSAASSARPQGRVEAPVVASAPIPPPAAATVTPPVDAKASPPTPAAKTAAAEPSAKRHAVLQRRARPRYRAAYQAAGVWPGNWASSGSWHFGPNPYSPNGGD